MVLFSICVIPLGLIFACVYLFLDLYVIAVVILASLVVATACLIYCIKTYDTRLVAHSILLLLFAILLVANNQLGGFDNPAFAWFLLIPVIGGILIKNTSIWLYAILVFLVTIIYYYLKIIDFYIPKEISAQAYDLITFANRVGALFTITLLLALYRYENQEKEKLLRGKEKQLFELANFDSLTALSNRSLFAKDFKQKIRTFNHGDNGIALLFIDLDSFKSVNDAYGHSVGDILLEEVAQRFRHILSVDDHICRHGGDEFLVMPKNSDKKYLDQLTKAIIHQLSIPFQIGDFSIQIGSSVGISFYPQHGDTYDQLVSAADIAMYQAKLAGGGQYKMFKQDYAKDANFRSTLAHELKKAIITGELELYYQPKYSVSQQKVMAYEALLRWNSCTMKATTDQIIRVAEDFSIIYQLGIWVIKTAFTQQRIWHDQGLGVCMAINISAKQLLRPDFAAQLLELTEQYEINPCSIQLELTESIFIDYFDKVADNLKRLHDCGFQLIIDDYGTGYASLGYLRRFPVSALKIDRLFIKDLVSNEQDQFIVKSTIDLANKLGIRIVAEGVETKEQVDLLLELGCDLIQGFYYGRPLPADQISFNEFC